MTHYSATSLEQIADELDRLADEATETRYANALNLGQANGLREAATLIRKTRLADPAMEAMVKALEGMMRVATNSFCCEEGFLAMAQADAALKLAKDNVMSDNPSALKRGDLEVIRKVRATNGGGYPGEMIPRAALKRLLDCGAIRFKPVSNKGDLGTPDHVWASRRAQGGYVIHGPNADAMLAARKDAPHA